MANFVRSFNRKVTRLVRSRAIPRRTREKSPSLLQRFWRTIPSYLPFYILVPVLAYALWYGLQPATVIAPFHLPPEDKDHPLPFSGEAVADALQDAIASIEQEAEGQPLTRPCEFLAHGGEQATFGIVAPRIASFQVRPVTVEVKGISPEAVVSAAREVLGRERYISGDVILSTPNTFQLMARANDHGPWMTDPREISVDGLKHASCELAESILGATDKNVLAAAWNRRGNYDDVVKLYGDLPTRGGDPDALNNLGFSLVAKGNKDEAIGRLEQALKQRNFSGAHANLANVLWEQGKTDEAIAEYRESIKLKPDDALVHAAFAWVLCQTKRCDEGIAEYRKALELKPDSPHARMRYDLGVALTDNGRLDEGITEWRKAIETEPDYGNAHASARDNLAKALAQKQPSGKALAH